MFYICFYSIVKLFNFFSFIIIFNIVNMRIAFLNCFSEFLKLKLPYQRFFSFINIIKYIVSCFTTCITVIAICFYTNLVSFLQVNLVFTNLIYRLFFIKCFLNILVISFYLFLSVVQPANKSVEQLQQLWFYVISLMSFLLIVFRL